MSQFLGYDAYYISLGSTLSDVQADIIRELTSYGWQVVAKSLVPQAISGTWGDATYTNARALDNSDWVSDATNYADSGGTAALPRQLQVQMGSAVQVDSYQITGHSGGNSSPKTWTLEYSDNGSVWTVADTQTNITSWVASEVKSYTVGGSPGAHLYWRLNVSATNGAGSACYITELRMHTTSGYTISGIYYVYMMPPSDQSIGNGNTREIVLFEITTTTITIKPIRQMLVNVPNIIGVRENTAGAVAYSLTINGVTVTGATGTAGSTAKDNLRALYTAIRQSADANFTSYAWTFQKPSPQNANDSYDWIYGIRTPDSAQPTISVNANCVLNWIMQRTSQTIQTQMTTQMTNTALTIDLTNGFVFYWQINKRGFAVSTKTNVGYYGPVHVCYADHAKALAAMPATLDSRILSPIELVVGFDGASSTMDSYAYPTNYWVIPNTTNISWTSALNNNSQAHGDNPFGGGRLRNIFSDSYGQAYVSQFWQFMANQYEYIPLKGSSIFGGSDLTGDDFQIHRMGMSGIYYYASAPDYNPTSNSPHVAPILDIQDWYKFRGATSSENLCLVADTVVFTSLAPGGSTASDTTLNVNDTTNFQNAGYVILEQEIIQYTGKTGTTLTGCTRGKFGTAATAHWANDPVYQGLWFTVINGGALLAGYTKPA